MIRLLYRFFDPTSGDILVGGVNIKDLDLECLRKSVAIVPQVSLFQWVFNFENTQFWLEGVFYNRIAVIFYNNIVVVKI